jgi:DUF1680 family protein
VYCLEELDQPSGVSLSDVAVDLGKARLPFESEHKSDLLGGVVVVRHTGVAHERRGSSSALYPRYTGQTSKTRPVPLTFIPYYAWANRQATSMQVWTPLFKA